MGAGNDKYQRQIKSRLDNAKQRVYSSNSDDMSLGISEEDDSSYGLGQAQFDAEPRRESNRFQIPNSDGRREDPLEYDYSHDDKLFQDQSKELQIGESTRGQHRPPQKVSVDKHGAAGHAHPSAINKNENPGVSKETGNSAEQKSPRNSGKTPSKENVEDYEKSLAERLERVKREGELQVARMKQEQQSSLKLMEDQSKIRECQRKSEAESTIKEMEDAERRRNDALKWNEQKNAEAVQKQADDLRTKCEQLEQHKRTLREDLVREKREIERDCRSKREQVERMIPINQI